MEDIRLISATDLLYHTKGFSFLQDHVEDIDWREFFEQNPELAPDETGQDPSDYFDGRVQELGYPAGISTPLQNLHSSLSENEQLGFIVLPIPETGKEFQAIADVSLLLRRALEARTRNELIYLEFKCLPRANGNWPCDEGRVCDLCGTSEFQKLLETQVKKEMEQQAGPSPELRLKTKEEMANMVQEHMESWFKTLFGNKALDRMASKLDKDQEANREYDEAIEHLAAILFQYTLKAE